MPDTTTPDTTAAPQAQPFVPDTPSAPEVAPAVAPVAQAPAAPTSPPPAPATEDPLAAQVADIERRLSFLEDDHRRNNRG